MSEVYIVSAVRSPICQANPKGSLSRLNPVELTAAILQEAVRRAAINPDRIDDIVWGSMTPLGDQNAELARLAAVKAGFPEKTPMVTLERLCGASQRAIHFACQAVVSGDMDIVIAGG
ncbi:MAG: beta-ketoacyl synthase N-terminal-like domain-containing protein, partial [Anaerolineaceae bacterium]